MQLKLYQQRNYSRKTAKTCNIWTN